MAVHVAGWGVCYVCCLQICFSSVFVGCLLGFVFITMGLVGLFLGGFGVVFVLDEFGWVFVVGDLDFVVLC